MNDTDSPLIECILEKIAEKLPDIDAILERRLRDFTATQRVTDDDSFEDLKQDLLRHFTEALDWPSDRALLERSDFQSIVRRCEKGLAPLTPRLTSEERRLLVLPSALSGFIELFGYEPSVGRDDAIWMVHVATVSPTSITTT